MDSLIYFPYISIPQTPWLYKSLLYWDSIDTITPEDYLRSPDKFEGRHMNELLETELIKPILPMNYIYQMPDFKAEFLKYVDSRYSFAYRIRGRKARDMNRAQHTYSRIHMEKMENIGEALCDRDLAYRDNEWYLIIEPVANDFMFYLAALIGEQIKSQPITDDITNFNRHSLYRPNRTNKAYYREPLRSTILENAFPIPLDISASDLYEFKQKHETQLKNFRKFIERALSEMEKSDNEDIEEKLLFILKEIEEEKRSIKEKMDAKWRVIDFGTIVQFGSITMAAQTAIQTGLTNSKIGVALNLFGAIHSVYSKMNKNKIDLYNKPLAYSFLVENHFNKPKFEHFKERTKTFDV